MLKRLFSFQFLHKHQRQQTIGTRLLLFFVCLVMLIGAVLGIISSRIAAAALIQQAEAGSEQMINLAGEKLDMKQQFFIDLSNQLSNNSRFIDHLMQITIAGLKEDERSRRIAEMGTMLGQLALSDAAIRDITLIPLEDQIASVSSNQDIVHVDTAASWIEAVRSKGGAPLWLPLSEQGYAGQASKPVVAYGKLLGRSNIGSHDFILLVQLDASFIEPMIADVRLSAGGVTAVVDGEGIMMSSNDGLQLHASSIERLNSKQLLDRSEMSNQQGIANTASLRNDGQLTVYRTSALSGWTIIGIAPIAELTGAVSDIKQAVLWVLGGGIMLAIGSGILLALSIRRPLKELETMIALAASGDFRSRMKYRHHDEIGRVAQACNMMMEKIGGLIYETRSIVRQLAHSIEQLSSAAHNTDQAAKETRAASEQIASGAVELALNAEQGGQRAAAMNEVIAEVVSLQQHMSKAAALAYESGFQGDTAVRQLLLQADESKTQITAVNERILQLSDITQSIEGLLQLMGQLSKKIKVLSLNATIEAVRAGAAGAGFKVIADEIRRLAEQSNASIEKSAEMTAYIVEEVHAAIAAVQGVLPTYNQMVGEVHTVHHVIHTMRERSEMVMSNCEGITSAVENLQQAQCILAASMKEVSAVSQQSSASTEQVASLCNQQALISNQLVQLSHMLSEASRQMEQHMTSFKLD